MSTTTLPSGTWKIDTSATTVTVTVKKLGVLTVPATLAVTSGTIEIDHAHEVAAVDITVDAASYASKNPKRNEHVLGDDFLDSATYPEITLHADAATPTAGGYRSTGTVTVKDSTSSIEFAITDVDVAEGRGTFRATATVDRTAIGVDKMPTFVIGRELQLAVTARAILSD